MERDMRMAGKTKNKLPPFVPLTWDMLNSRAYKELPGAAAKALPYFIGKVRDIPFKDSSRYETNFSFTYSEAKRLGFGKSTFYKVLGKLIAHGFIDLEKKGRKRSFGLSNSIFRLSRRWEQYRKAEFKDGNWKRHYPVKSLVLEVDSTSPESGLTEAQKEAYGQD